jgi:hypothetical protein
MIRPCDAKGRFIRRTVPAPLPLHVIFRVRRAVPPVSWPLQTRLRQPLNGGHRRQSLSPPSTICRMFMRMVLGPATGPPWPSVMLDLAPHRPDDAVHKTDFASVV